MATKPLMSEILKETEAALRLADSQDVSKMREFLLAEPQKPMLFVGNGGMQGHFPSLLYEQNAGIARSITPFMLRSMSDEALHSCRCLLMSDGGSSMDIKDATKRMAEVNPENTAGFTSSDDSDNVLLKKLGRDKVFIFPHTLDGGPEMKGFVSVTKQFYRDALFYKAFTGESASEHLKVDLDPTHCYRYELNHSDGSLTPLSAIQHFLVLYGGYGAPAAHYIESVLAESGMVSAQVTDYRNFCHGRFIFASNHTRHNKIYKRKCDQSKNHILPESDVAILFLVSPNEKKIAENLRRTKDNPRYQALPDEVPVITIETDFDNPLAAIDLHIKSSVFVADLGENYHGNNPFSPLNYNDVNKQFPKNEVTW